MKNNRLLLVIYFLLFPSIFLNANGFGLCERGDLIFREGVVFFGHTSIYCDWNKTGNPEYPQNQNIVEAPGRIHGVWEKSLSYFYQTNTFWGARTVVPLYSQRDSIINFLRSKAAMYHGEGCPYDFTTGYKGGLVYFP